MTEDSARTLPEDPEPAPSATPEDRDLEKEVAEMDAFTRAYVGWLNARAALKGEFPEEEAAAQALYDDDRAALRQLFSLEATLRDEVWMKIEALESELIDESVIGRARHSLLLLGFGAIKADLVNLGIGGRP
jgi:hypothetical protein